MLPAAARRVTPTDVSQFVRLEQCERFLRLRLSELAGHKFMERYGVAVQRITPLMTLSGRAFEDAAETDLGSRFRSVHYAAEHGGAHDRPTDNADVLAQARGLPPGGAVLLFQTRLEVPLGDWRPRGDVDLIKLSRAAGFLLDPWRLTVTVSRAERKMILVASRSVFSLFSPDEETFQNAQLWKNLLARTCTDRVWSGTRDGVPVAVWDGR